MNWRLSALDKYTLVSNSDSHSSWPWRIGREANVFELEELTYSEIINSIREKDRKRFRFTIETDPAYGKYHWTGHRNCNVSLSPHEAMKLHDVCPVCGRKLTKGVEQRVEELADRPAGVRPTDAIGYRRFLPLGEIIAAVTGASNPSAQSVWDIYNKLIEHFGDEYSILIDAPVTEMVKIVNDHVVDAIVKVREEKIRVIPGYDGVYGKLVFKDEIYDKKQEEKKIPKKQKDLSDFM
jgi:uncharacterized protein (TIGR00375 family)